MHSYVAVTAVTMTENGETHETPRFMDIHTAIHDPALSLLKLQWQAGVNGVVLNQRLQTLETQRKELSRTLENILAALADAKTNPPKDINPADLEDRNKICIDMYKDITRLKNNLLNLERDFTILNEANEDIQNQLRGKLSGISKNIAAIHDTRVEDIMAFLTQKNISVHADFKTELKALIKNPELEANFLSAIIGSSPKGFLTKLKGWFT